MAGGAKGGRGDALERGQRWRRREAADVQKTSRAPRQQTQPSCAVAPNLGQELAQYWPNGQFEGRSRPPKGPPLPYPTAHQIPNPSAAPTSANTPIPKPIITLGLPSSRAANGVSDFTTAASGHTSAQQ